MIQIIRDYREKHRIARLHKLRAIRESIGSREEAKRIVSAHQHELGRQCIEYPELFQFARRRKKHQIMMQLCEIAEAKRGNLDHALNAKGWCYGKNGEAGYQNKWHVCTRNSIRP